MKNICIILHRLTHHASKSVNVSQRGPDYGQTSMSADTLHSNYKINHIFVVFNPDLPFHYTTFMGLRCYDDN